MKLDKVVIKNFRNYIGVHKFNLDKKITIFYGDNGFGKSTFFDAIEWCLTSKISRFGNNSTDINKEELANHYIKKDDECSIEVYCKDFSIKRSFEFTNEGFGNIRVILNKDGQVYLGNENLEMILHEGFHGKSKFRKGEFINLLKKTYILSQEQITDFISSDKPDDRYQALADIMGYKDIINYTSNLKNIISGLKDKKDLFDTRADSTNKAIESKKELRIDINEENLLVTLNELKIERQDFNLKNLDLKSIELIKRLEKDKRAIQTYTNLINEKYTDKQFILGLLNDFREKETICNNELNNHNKEYNDILSRLNKTKKDKNNQTKAIEIKEQIRVIIKFFNVNNIDKYDRDFILSQIDKVNAKRDLIQYSLNFISSYNKCINTLVVIPNKIFKLTSYLTDIQEKCDKLNENIKNLDQNLSNLDNDELLGKLTESLNGILKFIENQENKVEVCPVCSTHVNIKLKENLIFNINMYGNKTLENRKAMDNLLKEKNEINNKISEYNRAKKSTSDEIKILQEKYKQFNIDVEEIKKNKYFTKNLFDINRDELSILEEKNLAQINLYKKCLNENTRLVKLLDENNILMKVINNKDNKSDIIILDIDNELKAESDKINNYINLKNHELLNIREKADFLKEQLAILKEFIPTGKEQTPFIEIIEEIQQKDFFYGKEKDIITNAKKIVENLLSNDRIEVQVIQLEKDKKKLWLAIKELNKTIESLDEYLKSTYGNFSKNIQNVLNKKNSSIQKYYKYLNPLPSNKKLVFEGEKEQLFIKVSCDTGISSSAWKELSSGQLNVLAISIFLAMNEAQKIHSLDFIGIDDPIQNMDAVNQYSICDILGMIKKQIIFSTHDINFIKLFIKKNEDIKNDIQVYHFQSPYLSSEKVQKIIF